MKRSLTVTVLAGAMAASLAAAPAHAAAPSAAPSADDCYSTDGYLTFGLSGGGRAPVHSRPYGNSPVISRIEGNFRVDQYCYNSHGNLWWRLWGGGYIWDNYRR